MNVVSQLETLSKLLGVPCNITQDGQNGNVTLKCENGNTVQGLGSISKNLARKSAASKSIFGRGREDEAFVDQWTEYRLLQVDRSLDKKESQLVVLKELDSYISDRVFFIGEHFTLADFILFHGLYAIYQKLTFLEKQHFVNLSRWFRHIQAQNGVVGFSPRLEFQRNLIYSSTSGL